MARHEVSLVDKIGGTDRSFSETKIRNGNAAGLLGVIGKICLRIHIRVITDDLNGILVGSDCTVSTKTPETGCKSIL